MNPQDPLSQLHDIHLPQSIGWWPPAPGWWLLAVLLIGLSAGLIFWRWYRYRKLAYKREALSQWQAIHARFLNQQDVTVLMADISELLKRTCITRYGRVQTAGLAGEQWLAFLDQTGKCTAFTQGPGQVLVSQRYGPAPSVDGTALLDITLKWLNKQC